MSSDFVSFSLSQAGAAEELLEIWQDFGVKPVSFAQNTENNKTTPLQNSEPVTQIRQISKAKLSIDDLTEIARSKANSASNLEELKAIIKAFEEHPLKSGATNMVFSDGIENSDIMIIGEAPGREEDLAGKPFVGAAGQLLDKMLASIGLKRDKNFYITNVLNFRPPGNRTPNDEEVSLSLPFLLKHIEFISPKLIIIVGGVSAKALLNSNEGITKLRGRKFEIEIAKKKIPTIPIFHPAYILRRPKEKALVWKDLLNIEAQNNTLGIKI